MARPRTPTNVLDARGAFKRNPDRGRARANEPVDERPLGDCPPHFRDDQAAAWLELQTDAPAGVLRQADRRVVELACVSLASLREPTMEIVTKDGSVITIAKPFDSKAAATLLRCLIEMGLTPASRSKVHVPKAPDKPSGFGAL